MVETREGAERRDRCRGRGRGRVRGRGMVEVKMVETREGAERRGSNCQKERPQDWRTGS